MNKLRISQSGEGTPSGSTPQFIGQIYIDELNGNMYNSYGLEMGQYNRIVISNYVEKTGIYTISNDDYTINCTSNTFNVTLPTAVGKDGQVFNIKNTGNGIITINTTISQTIDGELSQEISQWKNIQVQSTGLNWIIL